MIGIGIRKSRSALSVIALLACMAVGSVASTGDTGLAAPTSIGVEIRSNAIGEVKLTWNAVAGATHYRVGWIAESDVDRMPGADWLNNFNFVDRAAVSSTGGSESYTIKNLANGETYHFIVGSLRVRFGDPGQAWSSWQTRPTFWDDSVSCPTDSIEVPKPTVVFGDLNWSSALLQIRIAQYIVEKGYGHPTDVKFGATLPLFQRLGSGDVDVLMEIWLPNQAAAWEAARSEGAVLSAGESLGKDWQSAFVIPAYLQEQYPDLDSVEDLKEQQYKDLFKTAETGGKARLVSCVIGWRCEVVNAAQVKGYGLDDHVHIVNPGDGAALNADLYGAYENQEPWLGYQWGTNDPALRLDLVRLEEPAYSDECWFTTKACAYEDATVLIAVNPDLPGNAPDVVEMLRNWDFNIDVYKTVVRWQDRNPGAGTHETAIWWLNSYRSIWRQWVTSEAEAAILVALSTGRTPNGWPPE